MAYRPAAAAEPAAITTSAARAAPPPRTSSGSLGRIRRSPHDGRRRRSLAAGSSRAARRRPARGRTPVRRRAARPAVDRCRARSLSLVYIYTIGHLRASARPRRPPPPPSPTPPAAGRHRLRPPSRPSWSGATWMIYIDPLYLLVRDRFFFGPAAARRALELVKLPSTRWPPDELLPTRARCASGIYIYIYIYIYIQARARFRRAPAERVNLRADAIYTHSRAARALCTTRWRADVCAVHSSLKISSVERQPQAGRPLSLACARAPRARRVLMPRRAARLR